MEQITSTDIVEGPCTYLGKEVYRKKAKFPKYVTPVACLVELLHYAKIGRDRNIIECLGFVHLAGKVIIILEKMELDLGALRKRIDTAEEYSILPKLANRLLDEMNAALDVLRTKNILHCDIKPENILCRKEDDGEYHFKLADFGIAITAYKSAKGPVRSFYTFVYRPPELFIDECYESLSMSEKSGTSWRPQFGDLWALGATAIAFITYSVLIDSRRGEGFESLDQLLRFTRPKLTTSIVKFVQDPPDMSDMKIDVRVFVRKIVPTYGKYKRDTIRLFDDALIGRIEKLLHWKPSLRGEAVELKEQVDDSKWVKYYKWYSSNPTSVKYLPTVLRSTACEWLELKSKSKKLSAIDGRFAMILATSMMGYARYNIYDENDFLDKGDRIHVDDAENIEADTYVNWVLSMIAPK